MKGKNKKPKLVYNKLYVSKDGAFSAIFNKEPFGDIQPAVSWLEEFHERMNKKLASK